MDKPGLKPTSEEIKEFCSGCDFYTVDGSCRLPQGQVVPLIHRLHSVAALSRNHQIQSEGQARRIIQSLFACSEGYSKQEHSVFCDECRSAEVKQEDGVMRKIGFVPRIGRFKPRKSKKDS